MKNIIIAIDGSSSTGKSTLAKQLARALEYVYVDSGAMYRAVTLFAIEKGFISKDYFNIKDFILQLPKIKLSFKFNKSLGFSEIYLNDRNVEKQIRSMSVSGFVSMVSAVPEVRRQLVRQQRDIGKNKGIVMDGRDIGTVVFPESELKLFITASAQVRAERRYKELIENNVKVSFEEVLKNINERDYIDSHRENSPLRKADDAIELDNSNLSLKNQFTQIMDLVNSKLKN